MSMMDEAEKQINYEENFEVVVKLSNYILPSLLLALLIIGFAFQADILWLCSSYPFSIFISLFHNTRLPNVIIKSKGVIHVRN